MSRENIEKPHWFYALGKRYVDFMFRRYYKRITTINFDKVPFDEPIILAPNHQNALMDAMAVLNSIRKSKRQPVFLARSDIFEKPLQNKILTYFKMLPIYRIRDGISSLQRNDAIFDKTVDVIKSEAPLVILPEGNHAGKRALRPLKKGISRISFQAEESENFNLGIKIIPVGLDYNTYEKAHGELLVNFGEPIPIDDFKEIYLENNQKGMNALKKRTSDELKKLMIHIESEEYYDTIDFVRYAYNKNMRKQLGLKHKHFDRFKAQQAIIEKLNAHLENNQALQTIQSLSEEYKGKLSQLNLRDWVIESGKFNFLKLIIDTLIIIIALPIFLYGVVNNFMAYKLPQLPIKKIKDVQFHSSVKFVLSLISFPLFYIIQFIIVQIVINNWLLSAAYLLSVPLSGWLALKYLIGCKKLFAKWRFTCKKAFNNKNLSDAIALRQELISELDTIIKQN